MDIKIIRRARRWIKNPIYIPPEGSSSMRILAEDGPDAFRSEVERLCQLGSPWAAALLGHLHLTTDASGVERAIELCRPAADAGSAYAQYVLAWALVHADNQSQALQYLHLASLQNFSPATVDLSQLVCRGMGTTAPDPRSAVGLLRLAAQRGHRAALWRLSYIYRKENLGVARTIVGFVLAPFAYAWYLLSFFANPFNANVYLLVRRMGTPFVARRPGTGN